MRVDGEFSVRMFTPAELTPADLSTAPAEVTTAVAVGVALMEKQFTGGIEGRSRTVFTSAFDQGTGVGSYVALESFEGSVGGRRGCFNFLHTATTHGSDRVHDLCVVVPGSGTGELTSMAGVGGLAIDPDGTHRIWFDLPDAAGL
jgi:hypothetical protein